METVLLGDAAEQLRTLDADSVHCCVTSPPYFGLRDYGVPDQIGQEAAPEEYIGRLVEVFREVRRVLRPDGTLWLNIGDSYTGGGRKTRGHDGKLPARAADQRPRTPEDMKPKDLPGRWPSPCAGRAGICVRTSSGTSPGVSLRASGTAAPEAMSISSCSPNRSVFF